MIWKGNPELKPFVVPIEDVQEDPKNAREHDGRSLDEIAKSFFRYGQQKPIVVREDGKAVAGSGTIRALRDVLEWTHIAAVTTDLESLEATGYGITDNRAAEFATWDEDRLEDLLNELESEGVSPVEVGFKGEELLALLEEGMPDYEEFAERTEKVQAASNGGGSVDENEAAGLPHVEDPELPISPELHERHDYVVITVDNKFDWKVLRDRLGIETVRCKPNNKSTLPARGVGRVITFEQFMDATEGGVNATD